MSDFENGKINILISTTVIEVGVNVPNASMIVIYNANKVPRIRNEASIFRFISQFQ